MIRKIAAGLVIVFAIILLASIAFRLETFAWQAPVAIVSSLIGLIGAIGLLRAWPYSHQMAGLFPLAISGLIIWNVLSGSSSFSAVYLAAATLLLLALVIYDYLQTRTR
jgi:hypothetical protein